MVKNGKIELHKKWYLKLFFHVMSKTANGFAEKIIFKYLEKEDAYYLKIYAKTDINELEVELFELFNENINFQRIQSNPPVIEDNIKGLELLVSVKENSVFNSSLKNLSTDELLENWSNEISDDTDASDKSVENMLSTFVQFEQISCAKNYLDLLFHLIHDFDKIAICYRMNVDALSVKAYQNFADKRQSLEDLENIYTQLFGNFVTVHVEWSDSDIYNEPLVDDNSIEPEFFFTLLESE